MEPPLRPLDPNFARRTVIPLATCYLRWWTESSAEDPTQNGQYIGRHIKFALQQTMKAEGQ